MTMVEAAMGTSFLAFIGFVLMTTVEIGVDSHDSVMRISSNLEAMRDGARQVRDDLRATSEDRLTVETLDWGDSRITLQHPVTVDADRTWGVRDSSLGSDESDWSREDWSLRLTVVQVQQGGVVRRDLVRQLLDADGAVVSEEALVEGLYDDEDDPGFAVTDAGDVWTITVQTDGIVPGTKADVTQMDVRIRN